MYPESHPTVSGERYTDAGRYAVAGKRYAHAERHRDDAAVSGGAGYRRPYSHPQRGNRASTTANVPNSIHSIANTSPVRT